MTTASRVLPIATTVASDLAVPGACGTSRFLVGGGVPTTGYVVSLPGAERRLPLVPTEADVHEYLLEPAVFAARRAAEALGHKPIIGVWLGCDDHGVEQWCLDVSINVPGLSEALLIGQRGWQKAIYDVEQATCIDVPLRPLAAA